MPVTTTKKSLGNPMKALRARLSTVGVKRKFLNEVVLPSWWDDSLALTGGGFREAASYVCAHLGFRLAGLLDASQDLAFVHQAGVKYKKAKGISEEDVSLATHYAMGVARAVTPAYVEQAPAVAVPAPQEWRKTLLAASDRPWVCLRHILQATWELGIPVIHLRNLPAGAKKPDALTTMIGDRPVIIVMNGRKSPSWIAFIVAHELGHIHCGHLKPGQTLVDERIETQVEDKDELEANEFAALLLTGHSNLGLHSSRSLGPVQLANQAGIFARNYRVAPGVAALNYGFTTGVWAVANGAVALLDKGDDAGVDLRAALNANLDPDQVSGAGIGGLGQNQLYCMDRAFPGRVA